jgi:hypothetical protein
MAVSACFLSCCPWNQKGVVTTPTVRQPHSFLAISATTGALLALLRALTRRWTLWGWDGEGIQQGWDGADVISILTTSEWSAWWQHGQQGGKLIASL